MANIIFKIEYASIIMKRRDYKIGSGRNLNLEIKTALLFIKTKKWLEFSLNLTNLLGWCLQVYLDPTAIAVLYGRDESQSHKSTTVHYVGVGPEGVTVYSTKWKIKKMWVGLLCIHAIT